MAALKDALASTSGKRGRQESGKFDPDSDVSREFLAQLLGVDVRTITNLVDDGMAKSARGRFPLKASVQFYLTREREKARGNKGLNDLDIARQRKTIAEAELAEMDVAEKRGQSIPLEVHEQRLRERLETVAGNLRAISRYHPDILAATTPEAADALCERMEREITAELQGLSDEIE